MWSIQVNGEIRSDAWSQSLVHNSFVQPMCHPIFQAHPEPKSSQVCILKKWSGSINLWQKNRWNHMIVYVDTVQENCPPRVTTKRRTSTTKLACRNTPETPTRTSSPIDINVATQSSIDLIIHHMIVYVNTEQYNCPSQITTKRQTSCTGGLSNVLEGIDWVTNGGYKHNICVWM